MPGLDFERVFSRNLDYAARALRNFGVRDSDVEDVCQEVFLIVHRRLPELDRPASLRTWIYKICWRVAANYRRRTHRPEREHVPLDREPATDPGQESALEAEHARRRLAGILDALDPNTRAVFVLYELEELPMREVVEVVGCPLQTGYSRLRSARKQLLEAWGTQEGRQA